MSLSILGAGGHAKVAIEAWRSTGAEVAALYDDREELHGASVLGVRVLGDLMTVQATDHRLHIAIGDNHTRAVVSTRVSDSRCPPIIHVTAHVSPTAAVAAGTLICAGAVIQSEARIGRYTILNSQSLVEHDAVLGDYVHLAPGARLGGGVQVGARAMIGIGAIVLPGVELGCDVTIGAGAVVIKNVPSGAVVVGNPAKPIQTR